MTQALSQFSTSPGSSVGSQIADLLGVEYGKFGVSNTKNVRKLIREYHKTLVNKARMDPNWTKFANYLEVILDNSGKLRVVINGSQAIEEAANLIEFGDGQTPANPLMRVSEAEFNANFNWRRTMS